MDNHAGSADAPAAEPTRMTNMTGPADEPRLAWAPKWVSVIAAAVGAVVLAAGSATYSNDIVGRGLLAVAAALLVGVVVIGGVARPRLQVVEGGDGGGGDGADADRAAGEGGPRLAVRTLFTHREYAMGQLYRIRVTRYSRLARRVPILEIDAREPEEKLLLFSRWDLGTHPDRVYNALVEAHAVPPEPTGL